MQWILQKKWEMEVGLYDIADEISGKIWAGIRKRNGAGKQTNCDKDDKGRKMSSEEISMYTGLTMEKIIELEKELLKSYNK